MPVTGRKPKPQGQAVTRHQPTTEWTDVVNVPFTDAPKLPRSQPDGRPWPAWTKRWWAVVSTMPHAKLWEPSDWQYAFDTAALVAKFHADGSTGLATEIRNREKVLGTTFDYRRDIRVRYVDPPAENETPADVVSIDAYRDL